MFDTKNSKKAITERSWLLAAGLFVVAAAIVWKIIYIQNYAKYEGKPWKEQLNKTNKLDTIAAMRGNIYASDGSLLATSLPYYEISIDPAYADSAYFYNKIDSLCNNVVALFGKDALIKDSKKLRFERKEWELEELKKKAGVDIGKSKADRYIKLVAGRITFRQQQIVSTWPFFRKFQSGKTKGGDLKPNYVRDKSFGTMAERTIGNISLKTGQGTSGIERSFNTYLFGTPGIGQFEILGDGTRMPLDDNARVPAESGADVYLTLDVNFQDIAETSLRQTLKQYNADYGCVIVMKKETGEIKAMANLTRTKDSTYREVLNYAIGTPVNPGSTFKLATMMAALETKKISPQTYIETGNGAVRYKNFIIKDTKGHGTITAQEVMEESSNIGMHLIMQKSGFYSNIQSYLKYIEKFKLGQKTGMIIGDEEDPNTPKPLHGWDGTSATRMSYGYVWELTPLQVLTFYNAVANGGRWVRPMIVKQIKSVEELLYEAQVYTDPTPIASAQTIAQVQKMLLGVVENKKGTAHILKNNQYLIAGKTGTAQILVPLKDEKGNYIRNNKGNIIRGYSKKGEFNVSFAGYFPANNPQYTCIVMVSHPRGGSSDNLYAGSVAAPVFKNVADRITGYDVKMHPPMKDTTNRLSAMAKQFKAGHSDDLRLIADNLNLDSKPKLSGWVEAKGKGNKVKWTVKNADPNKLPDMHGMSLRDAIYLLENNGFSVAYRGHGKVTSYLHKGNVFELLLK